MSFPIDFPNKHSLFRTKFLRGDQGCYRLSSLVGIRPSPVPSLVSGLVTLDTEIHPPYGGGGFGTGRVVPPSPSYLCGWGLKDGPGA